MRCAYSSISGCTPKVESTCPKCHSREVVRKPRHRLTCTPCGFRIHADQAGSANLLSRDTPSTIWAGAQAAPRPETHRWNRHRWVDASHPSAMAEDLAA